MNAPVEDQDVEMFITLTNMCQALHALPRAGGVMDQDAYLVYGMNIVLNAQAERRERDRKAEEAKLPKPRKH